MTTYLSTVAKGNREDLSDTIYRISPTATPFTSMAGKSKATATLHEWQTQALATAVTTNAVAEGADGSSKTVTPTVRLTNNTQISVKTVAVSGTQRSVNSAGRADEMGYQMALAAAELKRDIEASATQLDVLVAGATRKSRGLRGWCVDNVNRNGGTLASYTANTGYTAGTPRAFTEAQVKDVLQQCFSAGGMPNVGLLPPTLKQIFSSFAGNATRMDKSEDAKLYAAVDFYVSDFGTLEIKPSLFQATVDAFFLQSDKWAIAYLRPFQSMDLAKTGDADTKELLAEWCVEAKAPSSGGAVYDAQ